MTERLPYFRTADRIQILLNQVHLWSGTRWAHAGTRPNEMQCGVNGDCLFWVHVFKAIEALPAEIEIPEYQRQTALADRMKRLRECIEATGRAEAVPLPSHISLNTSLFHPGDVLLFHNGTSGAHCGLIVRVFPTHFVHLSRNGLLEEPLNQSHWLDNLAYAYRLLEACPDSEVRAAVTLDAPTLHAPHEVAA
jgi:hypothetical protein